MNKNVSGFKKVTATFLCTAILLGVVWLPTPMQATAANTNLVFNGDGETSNTEATGWTMVSMESNNQTSEAAGKTNQYDKYFTLSAAPGDGVNGTNALKAAKVSSKGYAAMVSDPISITAGKDYLLSYSYKMTDLTISADGGYAPHAECRSQTHCLSWRWHSHGR